MNYEVMVLLNSYKGKYNQLHGNKFDHEGEMKNCTGDVIELFDSVDGELTGAICSDCGMEGAP